MKYEILKWRRNVIKVKVTLSDYLQPNKSVKQLEEMGIKKEKMSPLKLESILKEASETNTYVLLCDFNIGWLNKSKNEDSISIGGSTIKNNNNQNQSLKKLKDRGSLKILVYGGSNQKSKIDIIRSLENRLVSISSNIL